MPPKRQPLNSPRNVAIAAAVVLAAAIWALSPSKYSKVTNLDSKGSAIIAFGDSLTMGYGAVTGEDYPARLTVLIGQTVLNAGVSGDTTDAALARLDADVLEQTPRIVIIGLGGNDYLQSIPITTTEARLRTIVRKIHDAGAMAVLLGFRFPTLNANYDDMYRRVAKDEKALLIDDILDGILSDPKLKSDAIHPNARGYQLMAERIAGPLQKLLEKANATR